MASIEELLEVSRKTLERSYQILEAGQKRVDHAQEYIAARRREKKKQDNEKSSVRPRPR
jgi:hypothetical protein